MTVEAIPMEQQEVSDNYFPEGVDMPKRPPWDFNMSKEHLDMKEQRYFTVRIIFLFIHYQSRLIHLNLILLKFIH